MAKTLTRLTMAELKDFCVEMEVVEVMALMKDYLLAGGADPQTYVFRSRIEDDVVTSDNSRPINVTQPAPFTLTGPRRGHRWLKWKEEFTNYLSLLGDISEEKKKALLLHCSGTDVQEWHRTLKYEVQEEENVYTATLRAMAEACTPVEAIQFERFTLGEM